MLLILLFLLLLRFVLFKLPLALDFTDFGLNGLLVLFGLELVPFGLIVLVITVVLADDAEVRGEAYDLLAVLGRIVSLNYLEDFLFTLLFGKLSLFQVLQELRDSIFFLF